MILLEVRLLKLMEELNNKYAAENAKHWNQIYCDGLMANDDAILKAQVRQFCHEGIDVILYAFEIKKELIPEERLARLNSLINKICQQTQEIGQ